MPQVSLLNLIIFFNKLEKQADGISKTKAHTVINKVKFCCVIQNSVRQLLPETWLWRISLERKRKIRTMDIDVSDGLHCS